MNFTYGNTIMFSNTIGYTSPTAYAEILGSRDYPSIHGVVYFFQTPFGTVVTTEVSGLPVTPGRCGNGFFAFHIHEGSQCQGNEDPFEATGGHYNPLNCPHPMHAGDLPPLLSNHGYAWSAVLTGRFTVREIIGRTVVIHRLPDDFRTQPSGASGAKIACGEIKYRV